MKTKKTRISLNEAEWRLLMYAMNELKTELISEGQYTDVVNEVMLKIIKAPHQESQNRITLYST